MDLKQGSVTDGLSPSPHARDTVRRLRSQGQLGAITAQHRAIWRLTLPKWRLAQGLALALLFTAVLLALRPWIALAWELTLNWWMAALELPTYVVRDSTPDHGLVSLALPYISIDLPVPNTLTPVWHAVVAALVWWCAGWLPDSGKPVAFLLRLGVLVHAVSVVFFMFWSASFVHSVSSHIGSGLRQSWYLMLVTAWLHLMTYYLFPFAWWQRAWLTLVTVVFLFVLTPLQYALHLAIVDKGGMIMLPLLNLLFGVMLQVICIVALYGWAMSWSSGE